MVANVAMQLRPKRVPGEEGEDVALRQNTTRAVMFSVGYPAGGSL